MYSSLRRGWIKRFSYTGNNLDIFFRKKNMSLALLKREMTLASADLQTTDDTLQKKKQLRAQLGAKCHDIKKKTRKMRA